MRKIPLNLEGFKYATSLDLNIGYYNIHLSENSSNLCNIILPWEKYKYKRLPMGVCKPMDIFQEKINEMFRGIEFITAYTDNF